MADEITNEERLSRLKKTALDKLREAEIAMHDYARECDVGDERTKAFEVYERIRTATRL